MLKFIKKLVLAWDPDYTKVTHAERKALEEAEKDIAENGTISHDAINWDQGAIKITVSKAQKAATAKYEKENYDKILVRFPKGTKEKIKAKSDSVNGFIVDAVNKELEKQIDIFSTYFFNARKYNDNVIQCAQYQIYDSVIYLYTIPT